MTTTPNGSFQARRTITAGGRTRQLTLHAIDRMREYDISEAHVEYVLNSWQLRGIDVTPDREPSYVYFAYIPELGRALKVAVSIDDERIATTHFDRSATSDLRRGTRGYFLRKYHALEERNEGDIRRAR